MKNMSEIQREKDMLDITEMDTAYLDKNGHEINNPQPQVIDANIQRPDTLQQQIARLLGNALSARSADMGRETFEEANDFDIEGDFEQPLPAGAHEMTPEQLDPHPIVSAEEIPEFNTEVPEVTDQPEEPTEPAPE